MAANESKILLISGVSWWINKLLNSSVSKDIHFNLSKICFIKELDKSVSNVTLLSFNLTHFADEYGPKCLTDDAEVSVTHY